MSLGIGDQINPFRLKNIDGQFIESRKLAEGRKGLAVIFSCNHCPYVLAWEDRMIHFGQTYREKGVAFVLINANDPVKYPEDDFEAMVNRARDRSYPFPYLHDETQKVARDFGATRTPEAFLFDSTGGLKYHGRIDDQYENPKAVKSHDLRNALDALLNGREPDPSETTPIGCTIKWK